MKRLYIRDITVVRSKTFQLHIDELSCSDGTIIGVTGPNGSGKSTLLACLAGTLKPLRGTIYIDDQPVSHTLRTINTLLGYVPDVIDWTGALSTQEYLELVASKYRSAGVMGNVLAEAYAIADRLSFTQFTLPLHDLSTGDKKKVCLMAALMHHPKVVIMDDVRDGLDLMSLCALEEIIVERAKAGACVVLSSQDMQWLERNASVVLLLADGKPILWDSVVHIQKEYGSLETAYTYLYRT